MFRKSKKHQQLGLFSSSYSLLRGKAQEVYEDINEWHNQFRINVLELIDELVFSVLFHAGFGAPNASVRVLVGMMILKEAFGWSDSQMYENCRFNLLVRSALGLYNIDDALPVESTYYLFRQRIVEWEHEHGENLLEKCFAQITKSQLFCFNINSRIIRMDSKLLGSNIAWCGRYELIHETLGIAYKSAKSQIDNFMSESDLVILQEIIGEFGGKVSYRSTKPELEARLVQLGAIIYKIIKHFSTSPNQAIETLRTLFYEQYEVIDDIVTPLPKQQIKAASLQSPYDTDCHYREKGDTKTKGYSINMTETCDSDNQLNLITNVQVEKASIADKDMLIPAIEATQELTEQKVETVHTDGAYNSPENQAYCKENGTDFIVSSLTGYAPRIDLNYDENGYLTAVCLKTNKAIPVVKVISKKPDAPPKWKLIFEDGKTRYLTQKDIDTNLLRKEIADRPKDIRNIRNNAEATIFQIGYHYPDNKSSYRGIIKHEMWAFLRCLWVNFVRIRKYVLSQKPNCPQMAIESIPNTINDIFFNLKMLIQRKFDFLLLFFKIFHFKSKKMYAMRYS
jgi:hypothetical protein